MINKRKQEGGGAEENKVRWMDGWVRNEQRGGYTYTAPGLGGGEQDKHEIIK